VLAPSSVEKKLNTEAQLQTFPIQRTKSASILQRFHGEVAFTNFVIQKRDRQKTKTSNFFALPQQRAKSEPYSTPFLHL